MRVCKLMANQLNTVDFSSKFQITPRVVLSHEATQNTGVYRSDTSCTLSDGTIVIYAETSPGADRELHFFTKHGKTTG